MSYQRIKNLNYFDAENYRQLLARLDALTINATRQWGQMTAGQMLHHLNLAIGSGLGYYQLADQSSFLSRNFIKILILNVLRKFPIATKTAKTLAVGDDFDFETEKQQLREILTKAYHTKTDSDWAKHTYFGKMSRQEWGKLIMIHCHHHFQQFSV